MPKPNPIGYASVLASLKKHSGKSMTGSREDAVLAAVAFEQETDRGAVILSATSFEDKLQQRLLQKFRPLTPKEQSELFGFDRPLGSFSAKIRIAYAIGVLDEPRKRMADLVRAMRNACAHSAQAISFHDKVLFDGLRAMIQELGYDDDELGLTQFSEERPDWPRFMFLMLINELIVSIAKKSRARNPKQSELFEAYVSYMAAKEQGLIPNVRIRPTRIDPQVK